MAEKDDYTVQSVRIEKIVKELCPTCRVEYDTDRPPTWLRFRVVRDGVILAVTSGDWHTGEIADKSDEWLRQFLKQISGGKLGQL